MEIVNSNIKRIHVNQHHIRSNLKTGNNLQPLTVKTSNDNIKCHDVVIYVSSRVMYSPDKPLSCGAKVWIETHAPLSTTEVSPICS